MNFRNFTYSENEWFFMRFSLAITWMYFAFPSLWNAVEVSVPVGIASFIPLGIFLLVPVKIAVLFSASYFLGQYVYGTKQQLATLVISIISLLIFTMEESSGVFSRVSLLTLVWMVQFLAYVISANKPEDRHHRIIHASLQMIVAAYLLSAYSKWSSSGWHWVSDAKNLDLQVLKGFYFHWADNGNLSQIHKGNEMIQVVHQNQWLINLVLWFSLLLESFVFLMLWNRNATRIFGYMLVCMHIGIYVIMGGILILPVIMPMVIFTLNPLYRITEYWTKFMSLKGTK
ncbi:MAG: hypothetical protein RJB36_1352 [Bacteroidota bacterium]|jgi:hypothetical protein